jgi:hypothetical protein
MIVNPGKGDHRRPPSLRPKAGKSLSEFPFFDGRQSEKFDRGNRPLSSAPMKTNLNHDYIFLYFPLFFNDQDHCWDDIASHL